MSKTLTLTEFGNPILRKKAKPVPSKFISSPALDELVGDMLQTMHSVDGVGLAAPQIGLDIQLAVIEFDATEARPELRASNRIVLINPRILLRSKKIEEDWEGCLSFGGKRCARGKVPRSTSITVRYTDENGKIVTRKVSGFLARVFQHEIDHLNGKVFVDRMRNMLTLTTYDEFMRRMVKGEK
jgi:peptide deformylase